MILQMSLLSGPILKQPSCTCKHGDTTTKTVAYHVSQQQQQQQRHQALQPTRNDRIQNSKVKHVIMPVSRRGLVERAMIILVTPRSQLMTHPLSAASLRPPVPAVQSCLPVPCPAQVSAGPARPAGAAGPQSWGTAAAAAARSCTALLFRGRSGPSGPQVWSVRGEKGAYHIYMVHPNILGNQV